MASQHHLVRGRHPQAAERGNRKQMAICQPAPPTGTTPPTWTLQSAAGRSSHRTKRISHDTHPADPAALLPSPSTRGQAFSRLLAAGWSGSFLSSSSSSSSDKTCGTQVFVRLGGASAFLRLSELFKQGFRAGRHLSCLQRRRIPPLSPRKLISPAAMYKLGCFTPPAATLSGISFSVFFFFFALICQRQKKKRRKNPKNTGGLCSELEVGQ